MAGIVIDLSKGSGGVPSGGAVFTYKATNYTDLTTVVAPTANEGELAIVYNSQGIWLINRKLKGVYIYQSGVWEYANQELQDRLAAKIDSIFAGTNITIDNSDPLNPIVNAVIPSVIQSHCEIYFASQNAITTIIPAVNTPVKVAGNTTFGFNSGGWSMPVTNRIQNDSGVTKRVNVQIIISLDKAGGGGDEDFSGYVNQTGSILTRSRGKSRVDNTDTHQLIITCITDIANGQWLEPWIENNGDSDNCIAEFLNFKVIEILQ